MFLCKNWLSALFSNTILLFLNLRKIFPWLIIFWSASTVRTWCYWNTYWWTGLVVIQPGCVEPSCNQLQMLFFYVVTKEEIVFLPGLVGIISLFMLQKIKVAAERCCVCSGHFTSRRKYTHTQCQNRDKAKKKSSFLHNFLIKNLKLEL